MSDTKPTETRRRINLRTTRMEAFSDGIFAYHNTPATDQPEHPGKHENEPP